jgi:cell division protein FtsQ
MSRVQYSGRALWTPPARSRGGIKPGWLLIALLVVGAALWVERDALARTGPYRALFTVRSVHVTGETYLSESDVRSLAGLDRPVDWVRVDLARAARRLMKEPRIARATVSRAFPRRIVISIVERKPVALVRAGRLLEVDRAGVILSPLASGVAPDVPLVDGVRVKDARPGHAIADPRLARAIRHLDAMLLPEVALGRPVSEIDVSDDQTTIVTLAPDGVDVLLPAEPPAVRPLSALRVVLADLQTRGQTATRIDLRGEEVIAVRPIPVAGVPADSTAVRPLVPRRG